MALHAVGAARDRARGQTRTSAFPWVPLLVLSAMALVFLALLAEVGLRVAELRASNLVGLQCLGASALLQGQKGLYVLDSTAGYAMRPDTCVRLKTSEYDGVLRTNSQGMVGPVLPPNKAVGEKRIVVLGDSYTVGGQVAYAETFPAVLEQRLHDAGYVGVRVVNAGVGGYTTFNESGLLRERLSSLQPDLVVVAAFLGNDVSENVLATAAGYRDAPEHPKGMTWGLTAAQLVDQSGYWFPRNHLDGPPPPPAWTPSEGLPEAVGNQPAAPRAKSGAPSRAGIGQTARAIWNAARADSLLLGKLFGEPVDRSVSTAPGAAPAAVEQERLNLTSFEWTILREIPRTYWLDVAWPLFGRYLTDIRETAASVGAPVVVLAIPDMSQFDERVRARVSANFRFQDDEVDWDRPQRELAAQAAQVGLPVLDLLPMFRSMPDRANLYLPIDTHFTAYGHQVTARALQEFLVDGGYLAAR